MDIGVIITGIIGIITTITGSWCSWFFTRKKYNTEVDATFIDNMVKSLNFYKELSESNKAELTEILKDREEQRHEIDSLKNQMMSLMNSICTDLTCQLRKRNMNLFSEQNGNNCRQKVEETEVHDK